MRREILIITLLIFYESQKVSSFKLHTAAACFSKKFSAFDFATSDNDEIPLRANGSECGEDDFSMIELRDLHFLSVADGVGSWGLFGVDPKLFTTELLTFIHKRYQTLNESLIEQHDVKNNSLLMNIITDSYQEVIDKKHIEHGSCTLVNLSINKTSLHMNSYLLGDSGFLIVRGGKIFYRSIDLLHGFNWPFQVGVPSHNSDEPSSGKLEQIQLQPGDLILIGSDGLFDNLFDNKILNIINTEMKILNNTVEKKYTEVARNIAKVLTVEAKQIGETDRNVITPFSSELTQLKSSSFIYEGGKNDDTTVVVAIIE